MKGERVKVRVESDSESGKRKVKVENGEGEWRGEQGTVRLAAVWYKACGPLPFEFGL